MSRELPTAQSETARMLAVRRYNILDTPPDGAFDRITALAARRFGVPISIISIVDHDRIWFKSRHGLPDVEQIDRELGLCGSVILSNDPYILTDARLDARTLANPFAARELGLRFYAGVPLRTTDGHNLGTLCVIDRTPRLVQQSEIDDLNDLASLVMDQMELRLSAMTAIAQARLMAQEIDHRVSNSLQFVSSLLAMQSYSLEADDTVVGHLKAAASRVAAVAKVHQHFYAEMGAEISCIAFLRRLCADLSSIFGRLIEVEGDEGSEPVSRIQPIGLITNELVTNAIKHGGGRIRVVYRVHADGHTLSVSDEGKGHIPSFDTSRMQGLGMQVITSLAGQLGGSFSSGNGSDGQGACYTVTFST